MLAGQAGDLCWSSQHLYKMPATSSIHCPTTPEPCASSVRVWGKECLNDIVFSWPASPVLWGNVRWHSACSSRKSQIWQQSKTKPWYLVSGMHSILMQLWFSGSFSSILLWVSGVSWLLTKEKYSHMEAGSWSLAVCTTHIDKVQMRLHLRTGQHKDTVNGSNIELVWRTPPGLLLHC